MFDYAAVLAEARALIEEFGRPATFEKYSETPVVSDKPWRGSGVNTPTVQFTAADVPSVFVPPSGTGFGRDVVTETMLASVQQVALVTPVDGTFDLETANSVLDGAMRWAVEWVYTLKPGPLVVLYAFGLKR
jgi:hypothetical protein